MPMPPVALIAPWPLTVIRPSAPMALIALPAVDVTAPPVVTVTAPVPAAPALMPLAPVTLPTGATMTLPLPPNDEAMMPTPPPPFTLPTPVTVTLPPAVVDAMMPLFEAVTLPMRSTSTLPAFWVPPIAALMPVPLVAVVSPEPPTCTPALVPAALLFCTADMPKLPALTLPLPVTVTPPVPFEDPNRPMAAALTLALAVMFTVPALVTLRMSASTPRPPIGVPPPTTPAVVTARLAALPLDCARIPWLVALTVPAAVVLTMMPPVPVDCI